MAIHQKVQLGVLKAAVSKSSCHPSHDLMRFFLDVTSTMGLSPPASGFIECGSMLLSSPLPASSIRSISPCKSMDDLIFPMIDEVKMMPTLDRKGKGKACEPLPSAAKAGPSRQRSRADGMDEPKSSSISISPIPDRKGKGRAYEPGQPVPSNSKVVPSRKRGRADSVYEPKSSSISPIVDRKRRMDANRTSQPQASASGIDDHPVVQPKSSMESKSSAGPVVTRAHRKHIPADPHEMEDEEKEQSRNLKRLRRHETSEDEKVDLDVISISSDEDGPSGLFSSTDDFHLSSDDNFIVHDSSRPSSPPAAVQEMREQIREAIRYLRKDPTAKEMSHAQMDALVTVMTEPRDLMVTMKTGGGKSMLWMVPSALDDDIKSFVVCPFVALLEEQYAKAISTGLRCHNYSHSKDVPDNVQLLFVQVEHCSTERFAR
jgi:hypothetical protein